MRRFLDFKIKIKFEKIHSARSSINILKRPNSFFSNVKIEIFFLKIASKVKKNVIRISKIKRTQKWKRISKNFRSKKCFASSNMTLMNVAVYNLFFQTKKREIIRYFFLKTLTIKFKKILTFLLISKSFFLKNFTTWLMCSSKLRRTNWRRIENTIIK